MLWWDSFDEGVQFGATAADCAAGGGDEAATMDPPLFDIDFKTAEELLEEGWNSSEYLHILLFFSASLHIGSTFRCVSGFTLHHHPWMDWILVAAQTEWDLMLKHKFRTLKGLPLEK